MKRALRSLLSLIFVIGVTVALWPLMQNVYGHYRQYSLRATWQAEAAQAPRGKVARIAKGVTSKSGSRALKSVAQSQPRPEKWPATRIIARDIQLDTVVVQGLSEADLRDGPGHAPASALPGAAGNCVIAGHRNVYGSWFSRINELEPGATIQLRTTHNTFTYQVLGVDVVTDNDVSIMESSPDQSAAPRLTLITCTVPMTANRIVVRAEMPVADESGE